MSDLRLSGSERLLWSQAARPGVLLRPADFFLIPFSLMWGGFAVFWEAWVLRSDGPLFMKLWGIPFCLVGLYLIVGRFFFDAWKRRRTTYVVTSERVVILSAGTERSFPLKALSEITIKDRGDGSGSISFGSSPFGSGLALGPSWPGAPQIASFEHIPDVRTVCDLIRHAQKAAN